MGTADRPTPPPAATPRPRPRLATPITVALVLLPLALLLGVLRLGSALYEAPAAAVSAAAGHTGGALPRLLLALPVVLLACRAGAALCRRIGQPPVVGEIAVGVLLGPTLLGAVCPQAQSWLFPAQLAPCTDILGQLGLLSFMFLVGLELDLKALRGSGRTAVAVSQAGMVVPLLCGALLALGMYPSLAPDGVAYLPFALFLAVSMSITAFPVLARILADKGLTGTRLGTLALACAAVDDVTAWCLLALVVAVGQSGSPLDALWTALLTVGFAALMLTVVRPLLARLAARAARRGAPRGPGVLIALFAGLCLAALVTDRIGVHAVFGAFLFGVVTPRGSIEVERAAERLHSVAVPLLLPLFFVHTGLRADFGVLGADASAWLWCGAVLAAAVLGKWGGSTAAARLSGQGPRDALSLGALMNCRGVTELVVINIGLDLGLIGPELFTMLVLMALATTAMTAPAVSALLRRRGGDGHDGHGAERLPDPELRTPVGV
ncbi:hypothetical protein GCM10010319_15040 [Streptomyces blastmyceticus]|uniref:Cation/H+ exchanger transmembrane domain-containing protein n=1 Tax=Streptomyces blastmyceticus TaxID=68180 RepID=A0ABP3GAF9_9ACTN